MKSFAYFFSFIFLFSFAGLDINAQHIHSNRDTTKGKRPIEISRIFNTSLSDPELKSYKMESSLLTVIPLGTDTVSHRHDCELFGYVMEGSLEVGLEHNNPATFKAGEMFYEKRNVIHSFARNPDDRITAKVLLIFIIKEGRKGYTLAYPLK